MLGPGPAGSACTCVIHEEALLRPLHSRLRRRPVRGHAQKPLGGVGFPSHARTPAWADEAGLPARAQSRGRAALGAGRSGAGPSRAGRGLEVIPELRRRLRPCGETESGRRPRLWAQAETAAGAEPGDAETGRGPPERGERRSCRCQHDRCRAKSDKVSGGSDAPVSPAEQWPGQRSNGPGVSLLQPQGMPQSRPPETGQGAGELEFQSVVF